MSKNNTPTAHLPHAVSHTDADASRMHTLASALRSIRVHRGVSQAALAGLLTAASGVSVGTAFVAAVEECDTHLSWEGLARFCKCLGCLPSQVVRLAELLHDSDVSPGTVDAFLHKLPELPPDTAPSAAPRA